jgi:hypothetical protein
VEEEVKVKAIVAVRNGQLKTKQTEEKRGRRRTESLPEGTHTKPKRIRKGNVVEVSMSDTAQPC